MAITTQRVMFLLDRIYRFRAGSPAAPTEVQVESPVQVVHDVSRDSSLSAIVTDPGAAGFFSLDQDNIHAAGGETVDANIDPYGTLDATWGEPGKRWIWLMHFAAGVSSAGTMGAASAARLAVSVPELGNAITRRDFGLFQWNDSMAISTGLSATFPDVLIQDPAAAEAGGLLPHRLPFPLFPGTLISWRTIASAANPGTIRLVMLCWIGPFGVYPPGMR